MKDFGLDWSPDLNVQPDFSIASLSLVREFVRLSSNTIFDVGGFGHVSAS